MAGAEIKDDLTYSPLNAEGADAYPITAPTFLIVYQTQTDAAKAATLKTYLSYVLTAGQEQAGRRRLRRSAGGSRPEGHRPDRQDHRLIPSLTPPASTGGPAGPPDRRREESSAAADMIDPDRSTFVIRHSEMTLTEPDIPNGTT